MAALSNGSNKRVRLSGQDDCTLSSLVWNELPLVQTSVQSTELVTVDADFMGTTGFRFDIPPNENSLLDLNSSLITLSLRIVNADKTPLASTGVNVAFIPLCLHTIFKSVTLSINNCRVSEFDANWGLATYLNTMMYVNDSAKEWLLPTAGYWRTPGGEFNACTVGHFNPAFDESFGRTSSSRVWHVCGKLHLGGFETQPKCLPPGLPLSLVYVQHDARFALMSSDKGASYVYEIMGAKLTLNYLRPTNDVLSERKKLAMSRPLLYPFIASNSILVSVPPGVGRFSRVIYNGAIPSRIVLGVTEGVAQAGSYMDNPVNFGLHNIDRITYDVGNQRLPLVGGLVVGESGSGAVDMATPFMINQVCVCVRLCECESPVCVLHTGL
jgi:hypothetical protein